MTRAVRSGTRVIRQLGTALLLLCLTQLPCGATAAGLAGPLPREPGSVTPNERVVRSVLIRAGPSVAAAVLGRLEPGDRLPIVEFRPDWVGVWLPDGRTGWVSRRWTTLVTKVPEKAATAVFALEAIDVGTGLAVLVTGPDFTLLYDGGSNDDTSLGPDNRLVDYLQAVHPELRRIDVLVLSHPHRDHVELLGDVVNRYEIGSVWDSGRTNPICGYRAFVTAIAARPAIAYHSALPKVGGHDATFPAQTCRGARLPAATVRIAGAQPIELGREVPLGRQATMTVLAADGSPLPDYNANSVVVRLQLGSRAVLLMGDAEAGGRHSPNDPPKPRSVEGILLACCSAALRADVLVAGHHGSRTSSRTALLDAVGATDFVISAGPTRYASVTLPDRDVMDELLRRGRVWRTDRDDAACLVMTVKVGRDADGQPGGCDNVRLDITTDGVTGAYLAVRPEW